MIHVGRINADFSGTAEDLEGAQKGRGIGTTGDGYKKAPWGLKKPLPAEAPLDGIEKKLCGRRELGTLSK